MEAPQKEVYLSRPERLILGGRLSQIALTQGPEAAIETLEEGRQVWHEASSRDRQSDIGGIVTAIPYALRGTILKSKV